MIDREKVIKALECCSNDKWGCRECPYFPEMESCEERLKHNALELIKAQEQQINELNERITQLQRDFDNQFAKEAEC